MASNARTKAACDQAAQNDAAFDWKAWNADMGARFAATQRAYDAWNRQAEATHAAGLAVVEAFERAIAQLAGDAA